MRLINYLCEKRLSDAQMAARLGYSPKGVNNLRLGYRRPSLRLAWLIWRETDGRVGLADWFPDEQPTRHPSKKSEAVTGAAAA